ncbi:DUF3303 family protein [Blastococcus sp. CCUG 61487]|uniref:DUF3303 domain-containing protein n=1 Tax=Blastococcus sp. CCUG 61487 TaxID=1840703 RepID=UPI0010BF9E0A|nr:DUF3303 family protein [Blastococcus sp. CCUG 61487]TKJ28336.1 hypothetical protein A6V29_02750 [Blastococcus sp. CCUG 61487]
MKFLLAWKNRSAGSAEESLAAAKRSLELFSKWQPSTTVHQFVLTADAEGGYAIGETDDAAAIARDCAIFTPFLQFEVIPVVDVQEGVAILQQGIDFNESN